jgi:Flp pilus assembly pilin Flp
MTVRRGVLHKMRSVLADRKGQSTIEYFLILFIVVMIVAKFRGTVVNKIATLSTQLDSKLDSATQDIGN